MDVFTPGQITTAQTAKLDGVFGLAASAFADWEKIAELNSTGYFPIQTNKPRLV